MWDVTVVGIDVTPPPFEGIIAFEYDFQCLPTIASTSLRKAAWLAGRL